MNTNCEHFHSAIEEFLDGRLSAAMETELKRHLQGCAECQRLLDSESSLRKALSALPAPAMRAEFPAEVMARVRREHEVQHERWGFAAGFGSAIAAGLALWLVVTLAPVETENEQMLKTVSLAVGQTQHVNLVFDSPEELGQTTFAILLPENAELEGYPGRRELTWTASLRKGKNRLTLPVRVAAPGGGEIVARISQSDDVKVFRLKLKTRPQSGASIGLWTTT